MATRKLSPAQRRALGALVHSEWAHAYFVPGARQHVTVRDRSGHLDTEWHTTLKALIRAGYVAQKEHHNPYVDRAIYIITEAGRAALFAAETN